WHNPNAHKNENNAFLKSQDIFDPLVDRCLGLSRTTEHKEVRYGNVIPCKQIIGLCNVGKGKTLSHRFKSNVAGSICADLGCRKTSLFHPYNNLIGHAPRLKIRGPGDEDITPQHLVNHLEIRPFIVVKYGIDKENILGLELVTQ